MIKKLLVPTQIYMCSQCPHVLVYSCTIDGVTQSYFGCMLKSITPHDGYCIPEDCPLEDWS